MLDQQALQDSFNAKMTTPGWSAFNRASLERWLKDLLEIIQKQETMIETLQDQINEKAATIVELSARIEGMENTAWEKSER